MRREYDRELMMIKEGILLMSSLVEKMLADSVYALKNKDVELAREVIGRDDAVDNKEIELQVMVGEIIARQAPVATDLRRLSSTYKIITNLERIADMAVNISKRMIDLKDTVYMKELIDIPKACDLAIEILNKSVQAYVKEDIRGIKEVIDLEEDIDAINHQIQSDCLSYMMKDSKNIVQGSIFIFIGSYLERIGDHATNIFETVFYIVTGKMIDFNDLDEEIVKGALGIE